MRSLQRRPEGLDGIGVRHAPDVLANRVPHRLVPPIRALVSAGVVRVALRAQARVAIHETLQTSLFPCARSSGPRPARSPCPGPRRPQSSRPDRDPFPPVSSACRRSRLRPLPPGRKSSSNSASFFESLIACRPSIRFAPPSSSLRPSALLHSCPEINGGPTDRWGALRSTVWSLPHNTRPDLRYRRGRQRVGVSAVRPDPAEAPAPAAMSSSASWTAASCPRKW